MSPSTMRKSVPEIADLPEVLVKVMVTNSPDCGIDPLVEDSVVQLSKAIQYLEQYDFDFPPERESWYFVIPNSIREAWSCLSQREKALIYIFAAGEGCVFFSWVA